MQSPQIWMEMRGVPGIQIGGTLVPGSQYLYLHAHLCGSCPPRHRVRVHWLVRNEWAVAWPEPSAVANPSHTPGYVHLRRCRAGDSGWSTAIPRGVVGGEPGRLFKIERSEWMDFSTRGNLILHARLGFFCIILIWDCALARNYLSNILSIVT